MAVASSVLIFWGGCAIRWEWVGLAATIIRDNYYRIQEVRRPRQRDRRAGRLEIVPKGILNACFIYQISASQRFRKPSLMFFHQLLLLSRRFACRDSRDRVFGLLGLPTTQDPLNIGEPFIKPDYTMSTAQVYHEVALRILSSASSLSLLTSVQHKRPNHGRLILAGDNNDPPLTLPSWVPQWQLELMQNIAPLEPDQGFAACRDLPIRRRESNPSRLELLGIISESITFVKSLSFTCFWRGEVPDIRWGGTVPAKEHPKQELQQLLSERRITQAKLETLALTLTGGKDWYEFPVRNLVSHVADYAKCLLKEGLWWSLRDLEPPIQATSQANITISRLQELSLNGQADRFLDAAATACRGRQFFATSSGHPGIGNAGVSAGDLICVFHGANVPFVLMRQGPSFALLGECYIYDLMHGEAVNQAAKPGSRLQQGWIGLE